MATTTQRIIERAKRLPVRERRRVVSALAASLTASVNTPTRRTTRVQFYDSLLALAGTAHSDRAEVSSDKYTHVAAAYADDA